MKLEDERLSPTQYKALRELGYNESDWKDLSSKEASEIIASRKKKPNRKADALEANKEENKKESWKELDEELVKRGYSIEEAGKLVNNAENALIEADKKADVAAVKEYLSRVEGIKFNEKERQSHDSIHDADKRPFEYRGVYVDYDEDEHKWIDSDGNKYMGYLEPRDIKIYIDRSFRDSIHDAADDFDIDALIVDEEEAIKGYEAAMENASPADKAIFEHIIKEELEHIEELKNLKEFNRQVHDSKVKDSPASEVVSAIKTTYPQVKIRQYSEGNYCWLEFDNYPHQHEFDQVKDTEWKRFLRHVIQKATNRDYDKHISGSSVRFKNVKDSKMKDGHSVRTVEHLDKDVYVEYDNDEKKYYIASDNDRYQQAFSSVGQATNYYKYNKDDIRQHILDSTIVGDVKPHEGETEEQFISRAMKEMKSEYPDSQQRLAVAYSYWRAKDSIKDENQKDALLRDIRWCEAALSNPYGRAATDAKANYGKNWKAYVKADLERFKKMLASIKDSVDDAVSPNDIEEGIYIEKRKNWDGSIYNSVIEVKMLGKNDAMIDAYDWHQKGGKDYKFKGRRFSLESLSRMLANYHKANTYKDSISDAVSPRVYAKLKELGYDEGDWAEWSDEEKNKRAKEGNEEGDKEEKPQSDPKQNALKAAKASKEEGETDKHQFVPRTDLQLELYINEHYRGFFGRNHSNGVRELDDGSYFISSDFPQDDDVDDLKKMLPNAKVERTNRGYHIDFKTTHDSVKDSNIVVKDSSNERFAVLKVPGDGFVYLQSKFDNRVVKTYEEKFKTNYHYINK